MGLFSACFGRRGARDSCAPQRLHSRILSKLLNRVRRNQRGQDQLEEPVLIDIQRVSENFIQERGNEDQELVQEVMVREIVLESTTEPLNQEEKGEIETPNSQYFESVLDYEPVISQNGISRPIKIQPKMQFVLFCIFFLLCFYANMKQESQDMVRNSVNNNSCSGSISEMDQLKMENKCVFYVNYMFAFLFVGFSVTCYLFRESIIGTIYLMWYMLIWYEARNESLWLRWLINRSTSFFQNFD